MKKLIPLLLAAAMTLGMTGCNTNPKMGSGKTAIATSDKEDMLLRDYLYGLGSYKAQMENIYSQYYGYTAADLVEYWQMQSGEAEGVTTYDELKTDLLESMKATYTFYMLAKANNTTYNKEDVESAKTSINSAVLQLNAKDKTGERYFYEYYFVTPDEALETAKVMSTAEEYKLTLKDTIEIADEDVTAYYENEENREAITNMEKATVAHILLKVGAEATEEEKAELEKQANDLLERAKAGEDFGELAAQYSEDEGSNQNNGEYADITRQTSFVAEFLDWTFEQAENVGDLGLIQTEHGFHVMKLVKVSTDEEIKESIREELVETEYELLLTKTLEENPIEWTLNQEVYDSIVYTPPELEEAAAASEGFSAEIVDSAGNPIK